MVIKRVTLGERRKERQREIRKRYETQHRVAMKP
jgi:hypothetical protein